MRNLYRVYLLEAQYFRGLLHSHLSCLMKIFYFWGMIGQLMKNNIYLFLLVVVIALGSCKKSCNFPKYLDGKYCTDIRESLLGTYHGVANDTFVGAGNALSQDLEQPANDPYAEPLGLVVNEGDISSYNLVIYGLNSFIDDKGNVTIPNQAYLQALYQPYHASGFGHFSDTTLNGNPNKALSLYIAFTSDSPEHANYTFGFFGVR